jgi:hypothetical protein
MEFTFAHNNIGNEGMGLYLISDPNGYWIEIMPFKDADKQQ